MGVATYNNKHRIVLPLVPNACDYAELGDFFLEMQNRPIEVLSAMGDPEREFEVSRFKTKTKSNGCKLRIFGCPIIDF